MSMPVDMLKDMLRHLAVMFITLVAISAAMWLYGSYQKKQELEQTRIRNLSFSEQLDNLNTVQGSLNNLIQFVEMQKTKLKESEDVVNSLKNEQEKLKPVVEADRKTVDAILELQAQRTQTNVWRERWMGFGLGILASMLASGIITVITYFVRKRRLPPSAPATA